MKSTAIARLERLEQAHCMNAIRVSCVELVGVDPKQAQVIEPDCFRDHLGHRWTREAEESVEQFRVRVTAEAVDRSQPYVALISAERRNEATCDRLQ